MRRIDIVKRAGRNLKQAKLRTILTALAIAVGATTISMAFAAGKGGRSYIDSLAGKIGDQKSISVWRKASVEPVDIYELKSANEEKQKTEEEITQENIEKSSFSQEDVDRLSKVEGVKAVNPSVALSMKSARLENGEKIAVSAVVKTDEQPMEVSESELKNNSILPDGKVLAPKSFAKAVKMTEKDLIGKKVIFEFRKDNDEIFEKSFEIAAVDKGKTDTQFSYPNSFWLSNKDGLEIAKNQSPGEKMSFYSISVNVKDDADVSQVKNSILNLENGERYNATSFADSYETVNTALNIATAGLVGFGVLAILASVFGIINTQYISVLERTSQIGLMKSLGAKKSDVSKMFRYESAWIGFLGGIIGVAVAFVGTLILNPVIEKIGIKTAEVGGNLLQMDFLASGIMVVGLILVAVASGYFPARKASRMNPIEALRTE